MASVGYDLYVKMIEETVRELRGDASQGDIETRVDVKRGRLSARTNTFPTTLLRVEMYKKHRRSIRSERERARIMVEELIDRFGDPRTAR